MISQHFSTIYNQFEFNVAVHWIQWFSAVLMLNTIIQVTFVMSTLMYLLPC